MKRLLAVSSAAIYFFMTAHSAEAKPKKENIMYTTSYNYEFKEEKDVSGCITRATVALTKHGLSNGLKTDSNEDGRFGYVYGWNADSTATAEIDCDMDDNESNLSFSRYSDEPEATWEMWKRLRDARW